MPHFLASFDAAGPFVDVYLGVTQSRNDALIKAGQAVPNPIKLRLLVDTGASGTVVDSAFITQLGIPATGSIQVHTPSTTGTGVPMNQYDVRLFMPGADPKDVLIIDAMPVIESGLKTTQGLDGLLGRDVLSRCMMVYDGRHSLLTFSF